MNSISYINLLEKEVLNKIVNCGFKLDEIVFMQDNASCHSSKKQKNGLEVVILLYWSGLRKVLT